MLSDSFVLFFCFYSFLMLPLGEIKTYINDFHINSVLRKNVTFVLKSQVFQTIRVTRPWNHSTEERNWPMWGHRLSLLDNSYIKMWIRSHCYWLWQTYCWSWSQGCRIQSLFPVTITQRCVTGPGDSPGWPGWPFAQLLYCMSTDRPSTMQLCERFKGLTIS